MILWQLFSAIVNFKGIIWCQALLSVETVFGQWSIKLLCRRACGFQNLVGTLVYGGHNLSPLVGIGLSWLPKFGVDTSQGPYAHRHACCSNFYVMYHGRTWTLLLPFLCINFSDKTGMTMLVKNNCWKTHVSTCLSEFNTVTR